MSENKTLGVRRVRKSRWGPELPLPHTTDKIEAIDKPVYEYRDENNMLKINLPVLPNGTNDGPVEKHKKMIKVEMIAESEEDSCKDVEMQISEDATKAGSYETSEIKMEVSPAGSPVETTQELNREASQDVHTKTLQDLNTKPSQVLNLETSHNLNLGTSQHLNAKASQDINPPQDKPLDSPQDKTPESPQVKTPGSSQTKTPKSPQGKPSILPVIPHGREPGTSQDSNCETPQDLNCENSVGLNSKNPQDLKCGISEVVNRETQQDLSQDLSSDSSNFYGFETVPRKYSTFLKILETIKQEADGQKSVELKENNVRGDEQKNKERKHEKVLEENHNNKKEKIIPDMVQETESESIDTVHETEVESVDLVHETEGESVDMIHEAESERLAGKLSEDEFMKNDEGASKGGTESISSKNKSDSINESFNQTEDLRNTTIIEDILRTKPGIRQSDDETKDSDTSDRTEDRNGVKGSPEDGNLFAKSKRSRSAAKKTYYVDVSNPAFLKPFDFGWKRELVFRSTNEGSNKRNSDVYYYTPKGKKVRSFREVLENLVGYELTVDNFTFFKEPLGVEPDKEIIRDAKIKVTRDSSSTPPVVKKAPKVSTKSTKSSSKTLSTPATPTNESSPNQTANQTPATPKVSLTPKVVFKGIKPKLGSGPKFKVTPSRNGIPGQNLKIASKEKRNRKMSEDELEMGMLPPMWQPHDKLGPKIRDKENSNKAVPVSSGGSGGKSMEVCSIRCPLAMGLIPTLQCHVCLCLYHPECVGLKEAMNRTIHSYKCKNCQSDKAPKPSANNSKSNSNNGHLPLSLSPPPLTPISTLSSVTTNAVHPAPCSPPKLQRLQDGKVVSVPCSVTCTKTVTKTQSIVGGVTTWLPPSSTIQLSPTIKLSPSVKPSPPVTTNIVESTSTLPTQSLVTMNNKRYVIVPKHNVLSVSPAATSSSVHVADPSIPQSTVATSDQGVTITPSLTSLVTQAYGPGGPILPKPIPTSAATFLVSSPATPSTTFQNPPGVLLVPYIPPQSPNQSSLRDGQQPPPPQYVIVNGTGLQAGNLIFGNIPQQQPPIKLPAVPTSQAAEPSSESASVKRPAEPAEESRPAKKIKKEVEMPNRMQFFMMDMSAGYLAMIYAFQYLKVQELLRASRVCHMWRDIAMNKILWETVKMKNSRVRDWEGFAQTLRKVGTRHLDLRKMLVPDTQEALHTMWMEFAKAIAKVNSLRRLDLCKCSSRLIDQVATACPQLEGLSALAIRSNHLNLSCLERCKNLTDLRLKGALNSIDVSNIASLKSLNKLKFLSLTSVHNLSEDIVVVLDNLPYLESLELGECERLPKRFVTECLPKLTKLRRLRLEKGTGPDCPTIPLLETVSQCSQLTQLELVNFDIKQGFDTALALCTNIKTLLIIPTYITQSATTNHLVMEGVSKLSKTLTHFVWGLTLELLRVTDLFIDQWEVQKSGCKPPASGKRPGSGDSIPILKPDKSAAKKDGGSPLQVDVLQLPKLHKVLTTLLPVTKIRILKVPFIATWRQTVSGSTQ